MKKNVLVLLMCILVISSMIVPCMVQAKNPDVEEIQDDSIMVEENSSKQKYFGGNTADNEKISSANSKKSKNANTTKKQSHYSPKSNNYSFSKYTKKNFNKLDNTPKTLDQSYILLVCGIGMISLFSLIIIRVVGLKK